MAVSVDTVLSAQAHIQEQRGYRMFQDKVDCIPLISVWNELHGAPPPLAISLSTASICAGASTTYT